MPGNQPTNTHTHIHSHIPTYAFGKHKDQVSISVGVGAKFVWIIYYWILKENPGYSPGISGYWLPQMMIPLLPLRWVWFFFVSPLHCCWHQILKLSIVPKKNGEWKKPKPIYVNSIFLALWPLKRFQRQSFVITTQHSTAKGQAMRKSCQVLSPNHF